MAFGISAAALFNNLFAAGLARFGSLAFHKVARIRRIEQEIKARSTQNTPIARALHDLQIVIGTCYGPYTQELDAFFAELQRSGVIGLIAEEAAFSRKKPISKGAFLSLYRERFLAEELDAERLFDVVYKCFRTSLSEQANDKAIAFLIGSLDKSLNRRLEGISNSLASHPPREGGLSPDEYTDSARKISRGLQSIYKSIRVETNRRARMVDITRVYIPSKLRFSKDSDLFRTPGIVVRASMDRYRFHDSTLVEYKDFRRSFQRVIVLGDPGGGKSTLCQYLCYDLSKNLLIESSKTDGASNEYQLQKLPVRVVLRTFEKARKTEPQLDLFSFVCREIRNVTILGSEKIEQTLQRALEFGHVVLAFDGLDEILDTSLRRDFVELVVGFCDQFPLCPVCVTSRLVGYEEARLPNVFEEIHLERFDDREVSQYVEKFHRVVANHTAKESQDRAVEFLAQTETNAHDLRQNFLLLGLMAWLFYMKGDVPTNRPEIYSECAILMFERWDQRRGIEARIPSDFDMLHLFSQLAAKIYGSSELEDGVDSTWLRCEVRRYFEGQYEDRAKAHSASKALVDFITGRAWVMSEVGQGVFRFTHRTFLEFFFARHLDELHEGVNELLRILKRRIFKGEWDVVCHLSLQLKTYRRPRRVAEAITVLQDLLRQSVRRSTRQQASALRFAASALEYLPGSESEVRGLVSDVYAAAVRLGASAPREALAAVGGACHCSKERRELAQTLISDLLSSSVRRGGSEEVAFACTVLSKFDDTGRSLPQEVRVPVLTLIKDDMLMRALEDPFLACMYWEWYGENFEQLFQVHGFRMFVSDRRSSGLYLRTSFFYQASLPNLVFRNYQGKGLEEEARKQFRVIGRTFIDAPQVEVLPETPRQDWRMLHAPPQVWTKIFNKFRTISGDSDEVWGLIFCSITVFSLFAVTEHYQQAGQVFDLRVTCPQELVIRSESPDC